MNDNNEYTNTKKKENPNVDVRYIGVYHYGEEYHGDNIIFIDFQIYLENGVSQIIIVLLQHSAII